MQNPIELYLNATNKESRKTVLQQIKAESKFFPIELSEDLLCMNLDTDEKISILDLTNSQDLLAFEDFITLGSRYWDQNLSAFALRKWVTSTDHLLWYRILSSLKLTHLSQRIKYTILDLIPYMPGKELLDQMTTSEGLEELSPAFHALLINRCMQWGLFYKRVDAIALNCIKALKDELWPNHKAMIPALAWLAKYHCDDLEKLLLEHWVPDAWKDQIKALLLYPSIGKKEIQKIEKSLKKQNTDSFWLNFNIHWPPLWRRESLKVDTIKTALNATINYKIKHNVADENHWQLYTGILQNELLEAVLGLEDPIHFAHALNSLKSLLPFPLSPELIEGAKKHLSQVSSPHDFLSTIPMRFRLALHAEEADKSSATWLRISKLLDEEKLFISKNYPFNSKYIDYKSDFHLESQEKSLGVRLRQEFFRISYRNEKIALTKKNSEQFWSLLAYNWLEPNVDDLSNLSTLARKEPRLYHICYIHTLARFKGKDVAALKLLDYIRTSDQNELLEVVNALGGIGTPRALQELVSCITRPNVQTAMQLEICQILKTKDLSSLQAELRSALDDLRFKQKEFEQDGGIEGLREVCEALSFLITTNSSTSEAPINTTEQSSAGVDLDQTLSGKIPHYAELSTEVRRALRTAQFFYDQVESGKTAHAIDLSPVIDMQYKALELVFREAFEEFCFKIINQGVLQRKLDVIGYSRPIPKAMEEFENYIGSLPVIKDIPYFSKFKLRKMLRAICQYRPGRRFTLDGIKAFALFFLCFGRKKCQFGLANVIKLPFENEHELYQFCKVMHVFQDFRNRAAHEGFRPEARNDMEGIWKNTAQIIETVFIIKDPLVKS
ncbi:MAG: HEAT repeat domain-containing protein [Oligoflexales bacterium]